MIYAVFKLETTYVFLKQEIITEIFKATRPHFCILFLDDIVFIMELRSYSKRLEVYKHYIVVFKTKRIKKNSIFKLNKNSYEENLYNLYIMLLMFMTNIMTNKYVSRLRTKFEQVALNNQRK
jgi:hypothetical protein